MDISRDNYEEWMLDYIEGRLNAFGQEQLHDFLINNPDLKSELEDFEIYTLEPAGNDPFNDKTSLKKNGVEIDGISRNDYLYIQKAEGLLSDTEEQEYNVLLKTTPVAGKEQQLFNKTILYPENDISYPHKLKLKRVTILPFITKDIFNRAAAISIIILLATSLWITFKPNVSTRTYTDVIKQTPTVEQPISNQKPELKIIEPVSKDENTFLANQKSTETFNLKPDIKPVQKRPSYTLSSISGKGISDVIKPVKLNGYEIALNQIMPLYISSLQNIDQRPVIKSPQSPAVNEQRNSLLAGGAKIVGRITGNSLKFKKQYNEQGDVVAYSFATPNLQIAHKIKK